MIGSVKCVQCLKLCIIAPLFDIIANIMYVVSFMSISLLLIGDTSLNKTYSHYAINKLVSYSLNEDAFNTIASHNDLITYIDNIVYNYSNINNALSPSMFIPFNTIRIKKYTLRPSLCALPSSLYTCDNFTCAMQLYSHLSQHTKCSYPGGNSKYIISNKTQSVHGAFLLQFTKHFQGAYDHYELSQHGMNFDFTISNYTSVTKQHISQFINDTNTKFISLLINTYFPIDNVHLTTLAGIEMVNYFTNMKHHFSTAIYTQFTFMNNISFMIMFIIYCISIILYAFRFVYETNVNYDPNVHMYLYVNVFFDIMYICFISLYVYTSSKERYFNSANIQREIPFDSVVFVDHTLSLSFKTYCLYTMCLLFIVVPFRFISLITWVESLTQHVIYYIRVLYRLMLSVFIQGVVYVMLLFVFAFVNKELFNGKLMIVNTLLHAVVSVCECETLNDVVNSNIKYHPGESEYYPLYLVVELIMMFIMFVFFISSVIGMVEIAAYNEEGVKERNIVLERLTHIYDELKDDEHEDNEDDMLLKQGKRKFLWLGLAHDKELYRLVVKSNTSLFAYFTSCDNVITLLKYLFGLKHDLQYKDLQNVISIIIECKGYDSVLQIEDEMEVNHLVEWLEGAGCNIMVYVYTLRQIQSAVRLKLSSKYSMMKFVHRERELIKEIYGNDNECGCNTQVIMEEGNKNGRNEVCKGKEFTLYKIVKVVGSNRNGNGGDYEGKGNSNRKGNYSTNTYNVNGGQNKDFKRLLSNVSFLSKGDNNNNNNTYTNVNNNNNQSSLNVTSNANDESHPLLEVKKNNYLKQSTLFERRPTFFNKLSHKVSKDDL